MNTAKTTQLLDPNKNFISPATNIESLYYEVRDGSIIYRRSAILNFPVYVNYKQNSQNIHEVSTNKASSKYIAIDSSNKRIVNVDNANSDIMVSQISTRRIEGTNYTAIDVTNYNLSQLLLSYAGVAYVEKEIKNVNVSIQNELNTYKTNVINASFQTCMNEIQKLNTEIYNVSGYVHTTVDASIASLNNNIKLLSKAYSIDDLNGFITNKTLIAGNLYRTTIDGSIITYDIILQAISNNTFSENAKAIKNASTTIPSTRSYDFNKWVLKAKFNNTGIDITYMKDEWGNECNYDFKNKITFGYKQTAVGLPTEFSSYESGPVRNNRILSNNVSIYVANANNKIQNNTICSPLNLYSSSPSNNANVINNIIGYDTSISVSADVFYDNNIGNNSSVTFSKGAYYDITIGNNSDVSVSLLSTSAFSIHNVLIGDSNSGIVICCFNSNSIVIGDKNKNILIDADVSNLCIGNGNSSISIINDIFNAVILNNNSSIRIASALNKLKNFVMQSCCNDVSIKNSGSNGNIVIEDGVHNSNVTAEDYVTLSAGMSYTGTAATKTIYSYNVNRRFN